jgi:hypothetical protein
MRRREELVRTVFGDPVSGREFMRRIAAPREGWWRRMLHRRVRVHRAKLGSETVISERWK